MSEGHDFKASMWNAAAFFFLSHIFSSDDLLLLPLRVQPAWSIRREASYGHGKIEILNGTTAVWTWHRIQDGELIPADVTPIPPVDSSICHK